MPKVSVVIPCYNQGQYLKEAVESVLNQFFQDFEIIIVNDGSTEPLTNEVLSQYGSDVIRVIHTQNQGLSSARNNGIRLARGEYILPLDADDKIGREYLEQAVPILENNLDIGIVYCEAAFFGERSGLWCLPEYSVEKILCHNIVFCSALFRKCQWEEVGGYNINMVYGWEDWDFWLSIIELGLKVYRIPSVLFYYRVSKTSMTRSINPEKEFYIRLHTQINHKNLYRNNGEIIVCLKLAKLWVDTGLGYTERQMMSTVIFGDEKTVEFDLSHLSGVQRLQLCPVNDYAVINIHRIVICNSDNTQYDLKNYSTNACFYVGSNCVFDTRDPQIFLCPENYAIQKIIFHVDYIAIGTSSHDYIIRLQRESIDNCVDTIELMKSSKFWKLRELYILIKNKLKLK
jgi:glycosyltransferase involved in cell wall biosynthesis